MTLPCALTIAGSDSSGGAGIQADLRTFAALRVYGASAVTAVTVQNTLGVRAVHALDPALVFDQISAVVDDLDVRAVKTGMLANADVVDAVARALGKGNGGHPLVIDPVIASTGGARLLDDDGVGALITRLLPRAALVTPNLAEAALLTGAAVDSIRTVDDQERAARAVLALGPRAVLVKGGHAHGDPVDVLVSAGAVHRFSAARIDTPHTHGTGCTLSAAVAAGLARGLDVVAAVAAAHAYVQAAIAQASGLGVGRGRGPLHHMHPWYTS